MNITKYWENLNKVSTQFLEEAGYENFKQTVSRIYNDNEDIGDVDKFIKILWEELYRIVPEELLNKFSEPTIGNPNILLCDDRPISIDLGISLRDYWVMSQHIDFSSLKSIVEIGGGYGRMPYVITQLHPNIVYTMCDIEPSLGLAKKYLSEVVPNSNIKYISPVELSGKTGLLIACNCLHEMTRKQVYDYFNYADQNSDYFYYNCWKDTTIPCDYIRWEQSDYPVKNKWVKVFERDYIRKDYFEALYKT